jgi:hypothetical protein
MKKVISESVDRVEEGLVNIFEGFSAKLEGIFDVQLDEGKCSYKKKMKEEECDCEDGDEDCDCEELEENVIKNTGKEEVTFTKSKNPKKEKVSKFSKDGDETDGDSGYDDVKPSAETPDKKAGDNKEKDNEKVPTKESYSEFKEKNPKLNSTEFTKGKEGTNSKTPGFDDEQGASEKTPDDEVTRKGEDELDKEGETENDNAGFKEKEKPAGTALAAKKKKFPSKRPTNQGTPGSVKD